jgi:DNA polymerase III subunit delta'
VSLAYDPETYMAGWPVVGHERAVETLRRVLRSGTVPHAYLFTGPPGSGKRTLALAFAMALNCQAEAPPGQLWPDAPCGLCSSCSRLARGSHADLLEINLETQARNLGENSVRGKSGPGKELRIDAIREMQETVGLTPYSARWRVVIIGDAEKLNEEASNCLLKTLEEPPGHTVLMLLASDEVLVLPTVSSRCFLVPLHAMSRAKVAGALRERWHAEPEQAELVAALSDGRLGTAVGLLSRHEALARRKDALEQAAVLVGASVLERVGAATRLAKMYTDDRAGLHDWLDVWEGWWRDVMTAGSGAQELATGIDQANALASTARRISPARAAEAVGLVQLARQQLQENVNPRLALEALTLGLP